MEKIVATYKRIYLEWLMSLKWFDQLGAFKLPVEVVQYGADRLYRVFESKGYKPSFPTYKEQGDRFITDMRRTISSILI